MTDKLLTIDKILEIITDTGKRHNPKYMAAQLEQLMARERIEAKIGMVEYYYQASGNGNCNWAGLFAVNRQLLKDELSGLQSKQQEGEL